MGYWVTEIEESLKVDGYLDDLGLCEDCGNHHIYHVNPKGLQALYLLLFAYSRETGPDDEVVEETLKEQIDPQLEALEGISDEIKQHMRDQAKGLLTHLELTNFQETCNVVMSTLLDFLPPLEPRH